ncbi:MAG: hypothetical protein ACJ79R_06625 [Anaeromyxobacteraceae bacterium]
MPMSDGELVLPEEPVPEEPLLPDEPVVPLDPLLPVPMLPELPEPVLPELPLPMLPLDPPVEEPLLLPPAPEPADPPPLWACAGPASSASEAARTIPSFIFHMFFPLHDETPAQGVAVWSPREREQQRARAQTGDAAPSGMRRGMRGSAGSDADEAGSRRTSDVPAAARRHGGRATTGRRRVAFTDRAVVRCP